MSSGWRIFWLGVLAAHGTVAALWWWLMPGGFPFSSPHFWTNRILPPLLLAAIVATRIAQARTRDTLVAAALLAFPALWLAAAVTVRIAFPISVACYGFSPHFLPARCCLRGECNTARRACRSSRNWPRA
jgi:hypothetical protein